MSSTELATGGITRTDPCILLLDDDDFHRQLMQQMLITLGFVHVHHAATSGDALNIIAERGAFIHIVITDLDMPGIDGMEFLRLLADQRSQAAVLIMSGKDENILRSVGLMAEEYGLTVLGHLHKPATLSSLRDKLLPAINLDRPRPRPPFFSYSIEAIRTGLELDQFEPFFQPKVILKSRHVYGVEALARWRHPEDGIVSPSAFIGLVEQHELMDSLTRTMLEKSAKWIQHWRDAGFDMSVSINFSQSSLVDTRLSNWVMDVLSGLNVSPENITIEITETLVMTNIARCLETLSRLRMKGFELSIDDFGTGYSSLQQLARVPYTELKVDQGFVTGASSQPHLQAVMESSIAMARKLNMKCVGEGIESLDDWNCFETLGGEIGQGYFIAKPMAGADLELWLADWRRRSTYQ